MPEESVLSVGQCYPFWQTGQDGFRLEWTDAGFILFAMYNGIDQNIKEQFASTEKMTARYTVIENVCYFTFRFGGMSWGDCPFSPAIYCTGGKRPVFPALLTHEGYSLVVLLINSATGELCAVRLIGLGHDFSAKWREWAMKAVVEPFALAEYGKRVNEAYKEYSSAALAQKGFDEGNEYTV